MEDKEFIKQKELWEDLRSKMFTNTLQIVKIGSDKRIGMGVIK